MMILALALAAAPPSAAMKSAVEKAVRYELKDPESARFKWPQVSNAYYYCGFVNAKNSRGGYTGFEPFHIEVRKTLAGSFETGAVKIVSPWPVKDESYGEVQKLCQLDYDINNEPTN